MAASVAAQLPSGPAAWLLLLLVLSQFWKQVPLVYHARAIGHILWGYVSLVTGHGMRRLSDATVTRHRVTMGELDWNGHVNNSCYSLETDVARYSLLLRLFRDRRGLNAFRARWRLANGGVSTFFLRELTLGQGVYSIASSVCGMDAKWLYIVSRFVSSSSSSSSSGGGGAPPTLFAISICRVVFKAKGSSKTVPPADVCRELGYSESDVAALVVATPARGGGGAEEQDGGRFCGPALTAIIERLVLPEAVAAKAGLAAVAAAAGGDPEAVAPAVTSTAANATKKRA